MPEENVYLIIGIKEKDRIFEYSVAEVTRDQARTIQEINRQIGASERELRTASTMEDADRIRKELTCLHDQHSQCVPAKAIGTFTTMARGKLDAIVEKKQVVLTPLKEKLKT